MPQLKIVAREIMDENPPYCMLDTPVSEISNRFAEENISGLLVVDEEKRLLGVITEIDLIDQQRSLHVPTAVALFDMVIPMGESLFEEELARMQAMTAMDLMQKEVVTVGIDSNLTEISNIMTGQHIHHLPVLDGELVVGMIGKHDVIKALVKFK